MTEQINFQAEVTITPQELNLVDKFVLEHVSVVPDSMVTTRDLFSEFEKRISMKGKYCTARAFNKQFLTSMERIHGVTSHVSKSHGYRVVRGVGLKE